MTTRNMMVSMTIAPDIAPYSDHTENNSKYVAEVRSSVAAWATYMVDDIACIDQWLGAVLGTLAVRHNPKAIRERAYIA